MAVGHTLLVIIYHMIERGTAYEDLSPQHFDDRDRRATEPRLVRRLERMGYTVVLESRAAA